MSAKNRNKLNFYIDLAMFIVMGGLIGIGLLIKYVLIAGQERWLIYGENLELTFWGLDRHEWGTIHLILGIILFILLVLHIVFHWKTIKCFFRRYVPSLPGRFVLVLLTVVLFILLIVFPVFVTPEKESLDRGEGRKMLENMDVELSDSIRIRLKKPKKLESGELEMEVERRNQKKSSRETSVVPETETEPETEHRHLKSSIEIKGNMTLNDVSRQFGVELSVLRKELNLPESVSANERLGRLRKRYIFTMGDVKTVVMQHGK